MIRQGIRRRLVERTTARARPLESRIRERTTLVIAPHPDDETLGCGGLVTLLRDGGTTVDIAFMTDGAGSHHGVGADELVRIRRAEAVAASAVLGVEPDRLHFLGHPDGALSTHEASATEQVADLLGHLAPSQVIAPHPLEPQPDHMASYRILERAARLQDRTLDALLYPVWFWDQWPWTNPLSLPRGRLARRDVLRASSRGRFGSAVGRIFPTAVDITTVLDRKRSALAAHVSQTERPPGRPDWPILADVADGDWLELLLLPVELYEPVLLHAASAG